MDSRSPTVLPKCFHSCPTRGCECLLPEDVWKTPPSHRPFPPQPALGSQPEPESLPVPGSVSGRAGRGRDPRIPGRYLRAGARAVPLPLPLSCLPAPAETPPGRTHPGPGEHPAPPRWLRVGGDVPGGSGPRRRCRSPVPGSRPGPAPPGAVRGADPRPRRRDPLGLSPDGPGPPAPAAPRAGGQRRRPPSAPRTRRVPARRSRPAEAGASGSTGGRGTPRSVPEPPPLLRGSPVPGSPERRRGRGSCPASASGLLWPAGGAAGGAPGRGLRASANGSGRSGQLRQHYIMGPPARLQCKSLTGARHRRRTATGPAGERRAPGTGQRRRSAPCEGEQRERPAGTEGELTWLQREHGSFALCGSLAPDSPGPACPLRPAAVSLGLRARTRCFPTPMDKPSFSPHHPVFGAGTNPNPPFLPRHTKLKDSPGLSSWNPFGPLLFPEQGGQELFPQVCQGAQHSALRTNLFPNPHLQKHSCSWV